MDNTEQQLNQRARQLFATLSKTGANKTGMHLRRERKGTFFCSKNDKNLANPIFPPFFSSTGVNFINMFTCSFYARRSRKHKKLLYLTVLFALLESMCIKAPCKMLVKLTPSEELVAWKYPIEIWNICLTRN